MAAILAVLSENGPILLLRETSVNALTDIISRDLALLHPIGIFGTRCQLTAHAPSMEDFVHPCGHKMPRAVEILTLG